MGKWENADHFISRDFQRVLQELTSKVLYSIAGRPIVHGYDVLLATTIQNLFGEQVPI
jgi:hypothetical protein